MNQSVQNQMTAQLIPEKVWDDSIHRQMMRRMMTGVMIHQMQISTVISVMMSIL